MMRCIIIDDEQLVRELLEDNLRQIPFLSLVGSYEKPLEANEILKTEQIDLIFLDIQMPWLNGLKFLESLDNPPLVILVTAFEKYALEGFKLNVVDYVLKPFSFQRILMACNRADELFRLKQLKNLTTATNLPYFFVNVEYTLVKIVIQDIEYVEGLKDYIKIYLSGLAKPVLTRMTMKAMEEKLPAKLFIRTHRSFLVAASRITSVKRDFVCIGKIEIPLSESYKENITRLLNPNN